MPFRRFEVFGIFCFVTRSPGRPTPMRFRLTITDEIRTQLQPKQIRSSSNLIRVEGPTYLPLLCPKRNNTLYRLQIPPLSRPMPSDKSTSRPPGTSHSSFRHNRRTHIGRTQHIRRLLLTNGNNTRNCLTAIRFVHPTNVRLDHIQTPHPRWIHVRPNTNGTTHASRRYFTTR